MKPVRALAVPPTAIRSILEHMEALADPIRSRMLLVLERHELTVTELCAILQLPQSTVSRHLKTLADDGWVSSRRDGTSRYYGMAVEDLDEASQRLWPLIREEVSDTAGAGQDERRLTSVLARRRSTSQQFFSSASGQWDRMRAELFGDSCYLHALLGLLGSHLVVGDLGCGTGQMTALVAPYVARVIAVDGSSDMLHAARTRLDGVKNIELRQGALEALPIAGDELDVALMALVLHHVADPSSVLSEVARVLRPGGRILIIDMQPHDRVEYQQQMGHVWLGFPEHQLRRLLSAAGFVNTRIHPLPVAADAKGPALFAATAEKQDV
jgi:ArsR family transcriptional regulator